MLHVLRGIDCTQGTGGLFCMWAASHCTVKRHDLDRGWITASFGRINADEGYCLFHARNIHRLYSGQMWRDSRSHGGHWTSNRHSQISHGPHRPAVQSQGPEPATVDDFSMTFSFWAGRKAEKEPAYKHDEYFYLIFTVLAILIMMKFISNASLVRENGCFTREEIFFCPQKLSCL